MTDRALARNIVRHCLRIAFRMVKPTTGRALLCVLLFLGVFSYTRAYMPTRVYAATADTLNFQARLYKANGSLVSDGSYSIEFSFYNSLTGGSSVWSETQATVQVKNGYFSTELGSVTAFGAIDWSQQKWMTMNVNGDGEMTPRIKLTAVPYAFRANQSETLTNGSGTIGANELVQLAPSNIQAVNSALAALRINQTGAGLLAQFQGNGGDVFSISKTGTITTTLNCSGNVNGGAITANASGELECSDDDSVLGGNTTLQTAYDNDTNGGDSVIALTNNDDSLIIRNPALLGTDSGYLLGLEQLSTGAVDGLRLTNAGTGVLALLDSTNANGNGLSIDVESSGTGQYVLRATSNNGATQGLYVRADGRVGIGTSSPAELLDITGAIRLGTTTNTNAGTLRWTGTDFEGYNGSLWKSLTATGGGGGTEFVQNGNAFGSPAILGTTDTNSLGFITDSVTQFTIDTAGNANLVNGNFSTNGTLRLTNAGALQNITGLTVISGGANITGGINNNSGGITNSGTVSGVTGITFVSGNLNLANGGIVSTGSLAGVTTITASGNINTTAGVIQTNSVTRLTNAGALTNITTLGLTGAISGGTTYAGSGNINTTAGALQTNSVTRLTNAGALTNITSLTLSGAISGGTTFTGSGNINTTAGALQTNSVTRLTNAGALTNITGISTTGSLVFNSFASVAGILKVDASGNVGLATGGTDFESPLTFNNGLTRTSNTVGLGGTLVGNTSLALASNNLSFTGNGTLTLGDNNTAFVIDSTNFDVSSAGALSGITTISASGAITAATSVNTINGLVINSGALSSVTSLTLSGAISGGTTITGSGNINTTGGGLQTNSITRLTNAGALTNITTLGLSGAITGATTTDTINGLIINAGALSGVTGMTFTSGSLNLNNGGITNTGSIAGATTVNATGLVTSVGLNAGIGQIQNTGGQTTTGVISLNNNAGTNTTSIGTGTTTGQISIGNTAAPLVIDSTNFRVNSSGALSGITTISASGAITAATTGNTINGLVINSGALSSVTSLTLSGAISGGTTISGSGNINTTAGGFQTNSITRLTNAGALTNITTLGLSGAITGATTTDTINGLIINAGALSGVTSITASGNINTTAGVIQTNSITRLTNAGALTNITGIGNTGAITSIGGIVSLNASSNFATNINIGTSTGTVTIGGGSAPLVIDSTNFDVTSAGALSGITTIGASGAITAAITGNTINGLIINVGALSGITGMTFTSGNLNLNSGGIINTGPLAGVTTIGASGLATISGGATLTGTINLNANSNNPTNINTGTSTGQISIGGANSPLVISSTNFSVALDGTTDIRSTSTAALRVRNAGGTVSYFTVNSSGNVVNIGSSTTDATAIMLVVDSYSSASDPTGINGAMYYNTSTSKFRCYEEGIWKDCIGTRQIRSFIDTVANAAAANNITNYWNTGAENNNSYPNLTPSTAARSVIGSFVVEVSSSTSQDRSLVFRVERSIGIIPICGTGTVVGSKGSTFTTNSGEIASSTIIFVDTPATTSQVFYTLCSDSATSSGANMTVDRIRFTVEEATNTN